MPEIALKNSTFLAGQICPPISFRLVAELVLGKVLGVPRFDRFGV